MPSLDGYNKFFNFMVRLIDIFSSSIVRQYLKYLNFKIYKIKFFKYLESTGGCFSFWEHWCISFLDTLMSLSFSFTSAKFFHVEMIEIWRDNAQLNYLALLNARGNIDGNTRTRNYEINEKEIKFCNWLKSFTVNVFFLIIHGFSNKFFIVSFHFLFLILILLVVPQQENNFHYRRFIILLLLFLVEYFT